MYKEYQIFEIIQNDINSVIMESLGISEVVSRESDRICKIIQDDVSKTEKKLIASGVGYKNGETTIEVFNNANTIKGVRIPPVNISFRWEYYNFRDEQYKNAFIKKNGLVTDGKSVLILNPYSKQNDKGFVVLAFYALSGHINQNTFKDTIEHELRHVLEVDIPQKQFSDAMLTSLIKSNIYSENYYARLVANILYLMDKHEISALSQGFYGYISTEKWKYGSVDTAVEHSDSYNLMMSLKEKIAEAEKLINNEEFINEIDKYNKFGINHKNFLKKANRQYQEILTRIGKVIVKAKQDFIKEGLNTGFEDIFNFRTTFFRKQINL